MTVDEIKHILSLPYRNRPIIRHKIKGGEYVIHDSCKVQVDGVWVDGVIYYSLHDVDVDAGQLYVRQLTDVVNMEVLNGTSKD